MGFATPLERRRIRSGRWTAGDNLHCYALLGPPQGSRETSNGRYRNQPQRAAVGILALAVCLAAPPFLRADKISLDEKVEIERGLDAEFATLKVALPKSKKPLVIHSDGTHDAKEWERAMQEGGPASRLGDEVQITRVIIESNRIVLEINGGTRSGHWYDHVQIGMGGNTSPVSTNQNGQPINGSHVALVFPGSVPSLKAAEIRRMLSPVFDFEKHSAAEQYIDKLPEPVKKAIKEQRAIPGMDKDQVLLALGKPRSKSRESTPAGDEVEDWIYGDPPGKMTFVKFTEGKVVKIAESYANIGGTTAPPLPPPR